MLSYSASRVVACDKKLGSYPTKYISAFLNCLARNETAGILYLGPPKDARVVKSWATFLKQATHS